MNKELTKILDFTIELEKLKTVTRMNKTLDNRQENSAEHSWHAAFVAESFSKFYPVEIDINKVLKMLLIHIVDAILPLINHLVTGDVAATESRLTKSQVISKKQFIIEDSEPLWNLASYVIDKSVEKGLYEDK
ncbi:HD domain-containing protein [Macrococcus animalis]|uniref:HD domain-containing protein n=1 Tax=Macrococcus animalis TaxID=3395467 RepID=UPI0039BDCD89